MSDDNSFNPKDRLLRELEINMQEVFQQYDSVSPNNQHAASTGSGVQVLNLFPMTQNKKNAVTKIRVTCVPCQISKQRCDEQRPCTRCTIKGKGYLSVDRAKGTVLKDSPTPELLSVDQVKEVITKAKRSYTRKAKTKKIGSDSLSPTRSSHHEKSGKKRKTSIDEAINTIDENCSLSGSVNENHGATIVATSLSNMFRAFFTSIYEKASPFALRDFIEENNLLWRFHMTKAQDILERQDLEAVREGINLAASITATGDEASQILETFQNIKPFHFLRLRIIEAIIFLFRKKKEAQLKTYSTSD